VSVENRLPYDERYIEYIQLFNERYFYDCHEVLEDLWLDDPGDKKQFYKGLIQFATAFYHLFRKNMPAFEKLLGTSKAYLEPYGTSFEGLDLQQIYDVIAYWQHRLATREGESIVGYDDARVPKLRLM
jgi:uncharacterized protein